MEFVLQVTNRDKNSMLVQDAVRCDPFEGEIRPTSIWDWPLVHLPRSDLVTDFVEQSLGFPQAALVRQSRDAHENTSAPSLDV